MVVNESISRDVLRLLVWYPLRYLILILPVRWGILLLSRLGDMHCLLSKGKKEILVQNLTRLKDGLHRDAKAEEHILRGYFRNHYIDHLLIFIFPKFGKKEVRKFVEISGLEYLDEALKKKKGVILLHGHFGPVHLPLVSLARIGYQLKQVGYPSDEGLSWIGRNVAFRLRLKYEAVIPADIINADSYVRPIFRWLGTNGVLMITGDGTGIDKQMGKYHMFEFFGQQVMFPLGPSILAHKSGATIMPMFVVPGEETLYKIVIEKPIKSDMSAKEGIQDITDQFIRRLEDYISRYPEYMHFLDRFKPGELIQVNKNGSNK